MASRDSIKRKSYKQQDWGVKAYLSDKDSYSDMMDTPTDAGVFPRANGERFSEFKENSNDDISFAELEDKYAIPEGKEFSWPFPDSGPSGADGAKRSLRFKYLGCDGQTAKKWCPGDIIDLTFLEYAGDPITRVVIEGPAAFEHGHHRPSAETPEKAKTGPDTKGQHRFSMNGAMQTPYKVSIKVDTSPKDNEWQITVRAYTRSGASCHATTFKKDLCGGCGSAELGWAGIHYTTQHMNTGESQTLTVINPETGTTYAWECLYGTVHPNTGLSTTYTAPADNANCLKNDTISLKASGNLCDYIQVAVSAPGISGEATDVDDGVCATSGGVDDCYHTHKYYNCYGVLVRTDTGWGGEYPGFTCAGKPAGTQCWDSVTDIRSAAMKLAGCCPERWL